MFVALQGLGGRAKLITMSTEFNGGHTLVFSGTGGGKTQAIVIPTALTKRRPIICLDTADEIHNIVAKAREKMGFKARVIEPGCGIDLFKMLKPYLENNEKAFLLLAHSLMAPAKENNSDAGRYFTEEASILAAGLFKHLYNKGSENIFREFASVISKGETDLKKYLEATTAKYAEGSFERNFLGTYAEAESRTFTSLQATTRQALIWASLNKFGDILSSEPEDALDPLAEDTDLYIKISLSDLRSFPTIVRQIIATFVFIVEEEKGLGERLMIIDEAYQVGKLKQLELIRDTMRKRGLHLMQIFQSVGQMEELYGPAGVRSWNSSVAARVFTNSEDPGEQEQISKAIGKYTANIGSGSKSVSTRGLVIGTPSSSQSENWGLQGVSLLPPEQVRTLPNDAQIVFFKGQPPLICGKAFSWRRREWQEHVPYTVNGEKKKLPY